MRHAVTYTLILIVFTFSLGSYHVSPGQTDSWKKRNDRGNRYEGLISINTGNPDFEVLSFTGFFEPFSSNVVLKVKFFYPKKSNLSIIAQEIDDQRQYWMEAKPQRWQSGEWNEFSPWPTGDVLIKEGVPADNLGVLIKSGGEDQLIPAFIYHSRLPDSVRKYTMYLRTNKNLKSVKFILSGTGSNAKPMSKTWYLGSQTASVPFPANLDVQDFKEGIIRVVVERELRNGTQKLPTREYLFYHKAAIR
jgi:hypothetical protein